jgi:DNA-binding transcriptional MerR regulator
MHIKKVDEETTIKEQTLTHYERSGFTVTEWGGVEY